jgi:hypothetical protein
MSVISDWRSGSLTGDHVGHGDPRQALLGGEMRALVQNGAEQMMDIKKVGTSGWTRRPQPLRVERLNLAGIALLVPVALGPGGQLAGAMPTSKPTNCSGCSRSNWPAAARTKKVPRSADAA